MTRSTLKRLHQKPLSVIFSELFLEPTLPFLTKLTYNIGLLTPILESVVVELLDDYYGAKTN